MSSEGLVQNDSTIGFKEQCVVVFGRWLLFLVVGHSDGLGVRLPGETGSVAASVPGYRLL